MTDVSLNVKRYTFEERDTISDSAIVYVPGVVDVDNVPMIEEFARMAASMLPVPVHVYSSDVNVQLSGKSSAMVSVVLAPISTASVVVLYANATGAPACVARQSHRAKRFETIRGVSRSRFKTPVMVVAPARFVTELNVVVPENVVAPERFAAAETCSVPETFVVPAETVKPVWKTGVLANVVVPPKLQKSVPVGVTVNELWHCIAEPAANNNVEPSSNVVALPSLNNAVPKTSANAPDKTRIRENSSMSRYAASNTRSFLSPAMLFPSINRLLKHVTG